MAGLRIYSAKSKELTRLAPIWACLSGVATSGQWLRTGLAQCERETDDGAGCGQVMKGAPSLSKPAIADRPVMVRPNARRRAKVASRSAGHSGLMDAQNSRAAHGARAAVPGACAQAAQVMGSAAYQIVAKKMSVREAEALGPTITSASLLQPVVVDGVCVNCRLFLGGRCCIPLGNQA